MENGQLSKEDFAILRNAALVIPIQIVIDGLGLKGEVKKDNLMVDCFKHATPKGVLGIYVGTNEKLIGKWRCNVCNESGNQLDLVMAYKRVKLLEACRWILSLVKKPEKSKEEVILDVVLEFVLGNRSVILEQVRSRLSA